jgi:cytochrome b6-f complex iron-sulfur subunit
MDRETNPEQTVSSGTETNEPKNRPNHHPAPSRTDGAQERLSRRNFLKIGMGALSAVAVLEICGASVLFLRSRSLEGEFGGLVTAGSVDSFPPGSVTEFPDGRFFLIRSQDGGFLAVHNRCPHLGCTVHWVPERSGFLCPCHASTFDFYGNHENPPVPRPLDIYPVQIEDTMVKVDTSQRQLRECFAPDQLAYA